MRFFAATALMLALSAVPAYSQTTPEWGPNPKAEAQKNEEKKRAKEIEQDYDDLTKRTTRQTKSAPSDPWQTVRPSSPPKPKQ